MSAPCALRAPSRDTPPSLRFPECPLNRPFQEQACDAGTDPGWCHPGPAPRPRMSHKGRHGRLPTARDGAGVGAGWCQEVQARDSWAPGRSEGHTGQGV